MLYNPMNFPHLREIAHKSNQRINLYHGAVRSAKTVLSLMRFISYLVKEAPPGDILLIGHTYQTVERNIVAPLTDLIGKKNFNFSMNAGGTLLKRRCYVVGCKTRDSIGRIKGLTATGGIYADEITTYAPDVFSFALSRANNALTRVYATCNADAPAHPIKKLYIDN
jgi:hypothetical protein